MTINPAGMFQRIQDCIKQTYSAAGRIRSSQRKSQMTINPKSGILLRENASWNFANSQPTGYSTFGGNLAEPYHFDVRDLSRNPFPELYNTENGLWNHTILLCQDGIFIDFTAARYGWTGKDPLIFRNDAFLARIDG